MLLVSELVSEHQKLSRNFTIFGVVVEQCEGDQKGGAVDYGLMGLTFFVSFAFWSFVFRWNGLNDFSPGVH